MSQSMVCVSPLFADALEALYQKLGRLEWKGTTGATNFLETFSTPTELPFELSWSVATRDFVQANDVLAKGGLTHRFSKGQPGSVYFAAGANPKGDWQVKGANKPKFEGYLRFGLSAGTVLSYGGRSNGGVQVLQLLHKLHGELGVYVLPTLTSPANEQELWDSACITFYSHVRDNGKEDSLSMPVVRLLGVRQNLNFLNGTVGNGAIDGLPVILAQVFGEGNLTMNKDGFEVATGAGAEAMRSGGGVNITKPFAVVFTWQGKPWVSFWVEKDSWVLG